MNDEQLQDFASCLLRDPEVSHIKVSEFMIFIFLLKTGNFGDIYNRLDAIVINSKLKNEFMTYRLKKITEFENIKESKERKERQKYNESMKISYDNYKKLVEIAKDGNKYAKDLIEGRVLATKTDIESFLCAYMNNYTSDGEKTS